MRLLVVEDNSLAAGLLRRALREAGYAVDVVHDGEKGLARLRSGPYDAAIVDFMLPGRDGLSIVQLARAEGNMTPVLMLTAKEGTESIVRALDAGVDDYVTKPYSVEELLARLRVLLRRGTKDSSTDLTIGDVIIDRLKREIRVRGTLVPITPKEFALLEYLALNCGRVVTRTVLLEKVWDIHFDPSSNVVDVHINRLRAKLKRRRAHLSLETVRGAGYLIRDTALVS
jgi:two-component system, OmpR family, response regulator